MLCSTAESASLHAASWPSLCSVSTTSPGSGRGRICRGFSFQSFRSAACAIKVVVTLSGCSCPCQKLCTRARCVPLESCRRFCSLATGPGLGTALPSPCSGTSPQGTSKQGKPCWERKPWFYFFLALLLWSENSQDCTRRAEVVFDLVLFFLTSVCCAGGERNVPSMPGEVSVTGSHTGLSCGSDPTETCSQNHAAPKPKGKEAPWEL